MIHRSLNTDPLLVSLTLSAQPAARLWRKQEAGQVGIKQEVSLKNTLFQSAV